MAPSTNNAELGIWELFAREIRHRSTEVIGRLARERANRCDNIMRDKKVVYFYTTEDRYIYFGFQRREITEKLPISLTRKKVRDLAALDRQISFEEGPLGFLTWDSQYRIVETDDGSEIILVKLQQDDFEERDEGVKNFIEAWERLSTASELAQV